MGWFPAVVFSHAHSLDGRGHGKSEEVASRVSKYYPNSFWLWSYLLNDWTSAPRHETPSWQALNRCWPPATSLLSPDYQCHGWAEKPVGHESILDFLWPLLETLCLSETRAAPCSFSLCSLEPVYAESSQGWKHCKHHLTLAFTVYPGKAYTMSYGKKPYFPWCVLFVCFVVVFSRYDYLFLTLKDLEKTLSARIA